MNTICNKCRKKGKLCKPPALSIEKCNRFEKKKWYQFWK